MAELRAADVLIIGAGPAGATAALALAEAGVPSTLLDDNPDAGGQIFRTHVGGTPIGYPGKDPRGDRLRAGPERWGARIDYRPGSQVIAVHENLRTWVLDAAWRIVEMRPRAMVVASGALEVAVPVPGWTLPGVHTLGGLQILLKAGGIVPTRPVVLGGAGPLLYLVAAQLAAFGAPIAAVVDAAARPTAAQLAGLARVPALLAQGLRYALMLRRRGIPILRQSAIVEIAGDQRAREIAVAPLDANWRDRGDERRQIAAEVVGASFGLRPSLEITLLAGCAHEFDSALGGWHPRRDAALETSIPQLFVAGDGGGIGGVEAALAEGAIVAHSVAERLQCGERARLAHAADQARRRIVRMQPFRDALAAWSGLRPAIFELATDDTIVCRCEDVTRGALGEALAAGLDRPQPLKMATRAGMGLCQGRTCTPAIQYLLALARGVPLADVSLPTVRAPLRPVPLGVFADLPLAQSETHTSTLPAPSTIS